MTHFRNSYKMVDWIKQKCVNLELLENYFNLLIWSEKHKPKIIFLNGKSSLSRPSTVNRGPWTTAYQFLNSCPGTAFTDVTASPDSPSTTTALARERHKMELMELARIWDSVICVRRMNTTESAMAPPWATGLKFFNDSLIWLNGMTQE